MLIKTPLNSFVLIINNTQKFMQKFKWNIIFAIAFFGIFIGGAVVFAQGDEVTNENSQGVAGVVFPVAELGNCGSKGECRAYCDDTAHMGECVLFAEAHGLMNKGEADRAKKFAKEVEAGAGPGKCNSPRGCMAYCEDIAHINECVAFAEKHDFGGKEYEQGKKLNQFLKDGGAMPGGCASRASCEAYCGDFNNAEECYAFSEKSGLAEGDDDSDLVEKDFRDEGMRRHGVHKRGGMPLREQMKKLVELVAKGETPGKCKSKNECESYCRVEGHMDECITFAEKMGFMGKEEVEQAKKFKSQGGPGGCKTQGECDKFCNTPENRETCFKFAEENNLIPKEELARIKESMVRMRAGLDNAPPEVRECLKSSLGETIIADIQSGTIVPGPEIGERMRDCFEKFGEHDDMRGMLTNAPPEVSACLKEKLGDDFEKLASGEMFPDQTFGEKMRSCFESFHPHMEQRADEQGHEVVGRPEFDNPGIPLDGARPERSTNASGSLMPFPRADGEAQKPPEGNMFSRMSAGMQDCVKAKIGDEAFEKLGSMQPPADIYEVVKNCAIHDATQNRGKSEPLFHQQNGQMPQNPQMEPGQGGVLPPSFQGGGLFEPPLPIRDIVEPQKQQTNNARSLLGAVAESFMQLLHFVY